MAGLKNQDMNVYLRFNMMREIAKKTVETKPNPTMDDLRKISSQVFEKWPFLSNYGYGVSLLLQFMYVMIIDLFIYLYI